MNSELVATGILFFLLLGLLYWKRKFITIEKIFFPVLYFAMLRTGLGLKLMDRLARRMPRFWKAVGILGIIVGFLGMVLIVVELAINFIQILVTPEAAPGVGLVLPFRLHGAIFVPPLYWILSIFFLAVIHEFSHGVLARVYGIPLKSSGFAAVCFFIPIIPAAFVEPDEQELGKRPAWQQLSVFAAGPLANIVAAFLLLFLLGQVAQPIVQAMNSQDGIEITWFDEGGGSSPAKEAGLEAGDIIIQAGEREIKDYDDLIGVFNATQPGDRMQVSTAAGKSVEITLGSHPTNEGRPYLGIFLDQHTSIKKEYEPLRGVNGGLIWAAGNPYKLSFYSQTGLLGWMWILSLGIGLFNLAPLGPIDGGRMLKVGLETMFRKEIAASIWKWTGITVLGIILFSLTTAFF